ncbi:protein kinase domain-containing protein [Sorangium sp. So ce233]|uniref:serine/threonine-protein kinase n=1 Tax=Sorangium sp. So ce233 TaxID=3133290 RepID=UPI003F5EBC15
MSASSPPAPGHPPPAASDATAESAAAQMVGKIISDRYRIVELVATGGMGAVYKAEHLLLRKWLAVKLLLPAAKGSPELTARFEREAIAGAHIQHPNIASATDFGSLPDGSRFLVLEYVRGTTLDRIIKKGPVPAARAAEIARQIAAALAAAHERGVIHRDLKPRNVIVEHGTDAVKLIDFGFAKVPLERLSTTDAHSGEARPEPAPITLSGMVFGTLAYMAPEAAQGMDRVDERSDLYALGLILYEMLAGKHPFDSIVPVELFRDQCETAPPPLRLRAPGADAPRELEALVMRLLRKDPAARPASARALLAALDAAVPRSEAIGLLPWKEPLSGGIPPHGGALRAIDLAAPPAQQDRAGAAAGGGAGAGAGAAHAGAAAGDGAGAGAGAAHAGAGAAPAEKDARGAAGRGPRRRRSALGWILGVAAVGAVGVAAGALLLRRLDAGAPALAVAGAERGEAPAAMQAPAAGAPGAAGAPPRAPSAGATDPGLAASATTPVAGTALDAGAALAAEAAPDAGATLAAEAAADAGAELAAGAAADAGAAPAGPGPIEGAALPAERARLVEAVQAKRWEAAEEALLALLDRDRAAFAGRDVMTAAAAVAVKSAYRTDGRADAIFDALESRLGPDGLDIAYEMVSGYGGTQGGKRAAELLRRPEVLKRASVPLRIAVELREAPCRRKHALFERAALEGDARALVFLEMLRSSQCQPRIGQCCFHHHAGLERAVRTLRDRLNH